MIYNLSVNSSSNALQYLQYCFWRSLRSLFVLSIVLLSSRISSVAQQSIIVKLRTSEVQGSVENGQNNKSLPSTIVQFQESFQQIIRRQYPAATLVESITTRNIELIPSDKSNAPQSTSLLTVDEQKKKSTLQQVQAYRTIRVPTTADVASLMSFIAQLPSVESVYKPRSLSLDTRELLATVQTSSPVVAVQTATNTLPWHLEKISATQAWEVTKGSGVVIGIIDTGIDWTHSAFTRQLWINSAEDLNGNNQLDAWSSKENRNGIFGDLNGKDDDFNGYTDDIIGTNFIDQTTGNLGDYLNRGGLPIDDQSHGTAVAGVIGASKDYEPNGVIGLAYEAKMMILKAFDVTGNAEDDDVAAAIVYGVDHGASVLSCSFGDNIKSPIVEDAIRYAAARNVVIVASSGNGGGRGRHYPSDIPEVISVGATTQADVRSLFSSYNTMLSLVAPGSDITTTALEGGNRIVSGTSFSAPLVAATIGLILSHHKQSLPVDNLRVIVEQSADKILGLGWNLEVGHGRLNARRALSIVENSTLGISTPRLDSVIFRSAAQTVEIQGSVSIPDLKELRVVIGSGDNLDTMKSVKIVSLPNGQNPYKHFITNVDIQSLLGGETPSVIRLEAVRNNGDMLIRSTRIHLADDMPTLDYTLHTPWLEGKRIFVISARTSEPTSMRVHLQFANGQTADVTDVLRWGYNHTLLYNPKTAIPTGRIQGEILFTANQKDTVRQSFTTEFISEEIQQSGFTKLPTKANRVFMNSSSVGYANQPSTFIASDLQNEGRHIGVYTLQNDTMLRTSTLPTTMFARGWGDANGDGIPEIWTQSGGYSRLFQARSATDATTTAFATTIFGDTLQNNFWAARMGDITGDNRPELFGYRTGRTKRINNETFSLDDQFEVYTFANGQFRLLDTLTNPTLPSTINRKNTFTAPGGALGDFNNNGKIEFAFADSDGDLVVSEWNGTKFVTNFTDKILANAGASTEYVTEIDIDGNGIPEILVGALVNTTYNNDNEYDTPLWRFRLYGKGASSNYSVQWEDEFYGVRYGRPFYNGIASGDVNNDGKQEILLSLFPSLYVFTFDSTINSIVPLWVKHNVWSNGSIVLPVTLGAPNSIGLVSSASGKTEFWQSTKVAMQRLSQPTNFTAHSITNISNEHSVFAQWSGVPNALGYTIRIRPLSPTLDTASIILQTTETSAIIPLRTDMVVVDVQVFARLPQVQEYHPATASSVRIVYALGSTQLTTAYTLDNSVVIRFTNPYDSLTILSDDIVEPRIATITNSLGVSTVPQSLIRRNGNEYIAFLSSPLQAGDYSLKWSKGVLDAFANPIDSATTTFRVELDTSLKEYAFRFNKIEEIHEQYIIVSISQDINQATLQLQYFTLTPYGSITSIATAGNSRMLRFDFDNNETFSSRGIRYTLTADSNVQSQEGIRFSPTFGNTVAWSYSASDATMSFVYPQPAQLQKQDYVTFASIPFGSTVVVTTLDGREIERLQQVSADGGIRWFPLASPTFPIVSGVYLYKIVTKDGAESDIKKFVLLR